MGHGTDAVMSGDVDTSHAPGVSRGQRLMAVTIDLAAGAGLGLLLLATATLWLLLSSDRGAIDPAPRDAALAWAIAGAAAPAWLAWLAARLHRESATPGQRAAGLRVAGVDGTRGRARLAARLAAHPFGSVGWAWAAMLTAVAGGELLAALLLVVAAATLTAGMVTSVLLLVRPRMRPLHDRLAGTRLVRA